MKRECGEKAAALGAAQMLAKHHPGEEGDEEGGGRIGYGHGHPDEGSGSVPPEDASTAAAAAAAAVAAASAMGVATDDGQHQHHHHPQHAGSAVTYLPTGVIATAKRHKSSHPRIMTVPRY